MSRRPFFVVPAVVAALSIASSLGAQVVGAGYQLARSHHDDMLKLDGPALQMRFPMGIDVRLDYLLSDVRRFENPCGFQPPSSCGPDTFDTSTRLRTLFLAARARLVSRGSFELSVLPEIGLLAGTITKRRAATGGRFTDYDRVMPGAGAALELSASRIGGTPVGSWIAARARGFTNLGAVYADAPDPFGHLGWLRSVEIGLTFKMR